MYSQITLQGLPCDLEVRYYDVILEYVLRGPKFWKWWNPCASIHVDPWRHLELQGLKKTAAYRIVQTIWNCKALYTLKLLLFIVKSPFYKIKFLMMGNISPWKELLIDI